MNDTDLLINRAKGNSFHWHQLSLRDAVTPGSSTYLFSDPQGVRLTFNSTGTITADASYDAYGQVIAGGLSNVTPFGYAGGYTDPTGLIYLVNRYYDPSTGQFLSVDPLVGITDQPYQYAGGDPLNFIDPLGLCSWYNLYCSVVQPIIHSPVYTWLNENLNPAYMALMGYYNEAQAAENGCSFWTVAKYGAEGVFGVVGTGAIAAGGAGAIGGLAGGAADEGADSITGFTQHGLEQALGRDGGVGVSDSAMADAVENPVKVEEQSGGRTKYIGTNATVVLNSDGEVITTWANSSAGWR